MISRIDHEACTGCGTCTKSCPLDVFRLDTAQKEISPCMAACPAGVDIRTNNYLIQQGRIAEAAANFRKKQPFPALTGRVCFHPCESQCTRARVDQAVNINALEQFIGDFEAYDDYEKPIQRHITKVAVVGSGPAGLSCAYFLAQMGFPVTVFEAMPLPGGMLRYGIPAYRLPDDIVARQVEKLEQLGVEFRCNTKIGKDCDLTLNDLKAKGFKAVMLAPGTTASRKVDIDGADLKGVLWGLEFLRAVRSDEAPAISGKVLVIGGGDVAVDAAITARRLGASEVHMACLESREKMPAYPHNQADALNEGIIFHCGFGPERILGEDGRVKGMELVSCVSVFDEQGKFAPVFDASAKEFIEADHIIFAIGQATQLEGFTGINTERGRFVVDPITFATSEWAVFAAGDAATGPASVVQAIAGGRECAESIYRLLKGADMEGDRAEKRPVVAEDKLPGKNIEELPRVERGHKPASAEEPFGENLVAYDLENCFTESMRCLTCGSRSLISYTDDCMTCYRCELNCPSDAIFVHPFKERFTRSLDQLIPAKN